MSLRGQARFRPFEPISMRNKIHAVMVTMAGITGPSSLDFENH